MKRLAYILIFLALAAAAPAQDEDLADPGAVPARPKKSRASALVDAVESDEEEAPRPKATPKAKAPKPAASPKAKAPKPAPKASPRPATRPKTTPKVEPIPDGALEALDQALGAYLKEKKAQPVVAQEPGEEELTISIETLDQSLDAQLKKSARQPATAADTRITAGLTALLETLHERGAAAGPGTPHTAALVPAPPDQGPPLPNVPTIAPAPVPSTPVEVSPTAPETAPPPLGTPTQAPVPTTPPPELAPLAAPARRYVLTRIAVSRDGGPEQDLPIPQGGALRPVPLAHRGGNPSVEMKMLLRVPGEIGLGESTQVVAQASAQAAGVAAELSLADEVVDQARAADGAETTAAAGAVSFSFIKRVGGVYAYQQTFAQGDGRTPPAVPPRSILLNWTDRDATLEVPFAWVSTSPASISLRGRLIYAPAK